MMHYCVISHTHWDREWYLTQEQFRLRLVDLMDHLLALLEREPDYVFHLDAQTIVLEDYWEIRPERREQCQALIREKRLLVGPWYVQNDFLLTSGESTVRNLLLGRTQARDAGGCMNVGYTPDQFGLISQLPQILRGFGMNECVFGRGYNEYEVDEAGACKPLRTPSEFLWRGADGSEVLAVCMSFWYNNAQRFSADPQRALRLVLRQKEQFAGIAATPYLLLMNGCDHLEAQEDLLTVLKQVQALLPPDEKIYQTTLEHYLSLVRCALPRAELPVRCGELIRGADHNLLKDTSSSRIYLKAENARLESMLTAELEPLYATLEMAGMNDAYPAGFFDYLWKMLIRNHAHDSICGCSKDAVHRHMEERFAAIAETAQDLQTRGLDLLAAHVERADLDEGDYLIAVYNGLERPRNGCVEVCVDVLAKEGATGLRVLDPQGGDVPYVLLNHSRVNRRITSPLNLPSFLEVDRFHIRMIARDVPAFGSVVYRVTIRAAEVPVLTSKPAAEPVLENRFLRLQAAPDGRLDLLHKGSGRWYRDVLTLEDRADVGHSYISIAPPGDVPVPLSGLRGIWTDRSDDNRQRMTLRYDWSLPANWDRASGARSGERVNCPVELCFTLDADAPWVALDVTLENRAKDHRLLALVRTGIQSPVTEALSPFDLVERDRRDIDVRICNETRHNSGLVTIHDARGGLSVLNRGVYGYEHLERAEGVVSFTLLRATGRIWPEDTAGAPEDDAWDAPENQCLRRVKLPLALYPHSGGALEGDALFAQRSFCAPLLAKSAPVDTRKFLGGRPALQDASIDEDFFQPDPYPGVRLPRRFAPFHLEGDALAVTAWKRSWDRTAWVLRFFNASSSAQRARVVFEDLRAKRVWRSDLQEEAREACPIVDSAVELTVRPKEIVTLVIEA